MTEALDVRIQGDSMWPTYHDGDLISLVVCDHNYTPSENDVVLVEHPLKSGVLMVKRISTVEASGRLFLTGDHPDPLASEDSHNFGPVSPELVKAYLR
tara:strand:- start:3808 stop:4101 length:294 start_codon:yes stop_codon:yes gene_type:complete